MLKEQSDLACDGLFYTYKKQGSFYVCNILDVKILIKAVGTFINIFVLFFSFLDYKCWMLDYIPKSSTIIYK